jgi:hypothetical protein
LSLGVDEKPSTSKEQSATLLKSDVVEKSVALKLLEQTQSICESLGLDQLGRNCESVAAHIATDQSPPPPKPDDWRARVHLCEGQTANREGATMTIAPLGQPEPMGRTHSLYRRI